MSRWDRWPTRVASGNAAGRLPRGKPDEGEPHVRFGKREQETGRKPPRLLPTSLPGDRPVRPDHRCSGVGEAGSGGYRRFFTGALNATAVTPVEVITDKAAVYPRVLDELAPGAWHHTEQHANNRIEADHGRLKARLQPMRGLKRLRCARVIAAGHAFVQNIRRGHYELGVEQPTTLRVTGAFTELTVAI